MSSGIAGRVGIADHLSAMLRFYRVCIWLPILLPAIPAIGFKWFGLSASTPFGLWLGFFAISLFGVFPYAVLAVWATWRIGRLSEGRIRALAIKAPFLMLLVFLPFALFVGSHGGGGLVGGLWFFAVGAIWILSFGYCYVGVVQLLAHFIAPYLRPIRPPLVTFR
jgi:hypothetical protein